MRYNGGVVKTWSKKEVIDILASEALSNWLSVEQVAELLKKAAKKWYRMKILKKTIKRRGSAKLKYADSSWVFEKKSLTSFS